MLYEKLLGAVPESTPADPYFKNVSMLLPGDVNQSLTYTAFSDASTNNFLLTPNGDTYGTPFSPYNTSWSNYFDGSGDYLSAGDQTAFEFGSGDYTIEFWLFAASFASDQNLIGKWDGGGSEWILQWRSAGYFRWASGGSVILDATVTPQANSWNHVAISKSGSSLRIFLNGTQIGTTATEGAISATGAALTIGAAQVNSTPNYTTGYFSNVRIVKGTAVYTGTFTPPSLANLATSGSASAACYPSTTNVNTSFAASATSLLTCQSNRFIDNSSNNFTLTVNGNTAIKAFSPIADTDTTTGSGYFDGTGDYLTLANNANLDMGSSSFTIEGWFYTNSVAAGYKPIITRFNGNASAQTDLQYFIGQNGSTLQLSAYGASVVQISFTSALSVGQWYHFALVRDGNNIYGYLNGVRNATTGTISGALNNGTWTTYIGYYNEGGSIGYLNGYASNIRIVKGTALYTGSTYTVPTSPLTAVSGTSLLTLQTRGAVQNIGFIDSSANKFPITKVGNTTQGTFSPYGNLWSNYFDGTGDYLKLPNDLNFTFGTGDFTVECFVYFSSVGGSSRSIYGSDAEATGGVLSFYAYTNGALRVQLGTTLLDSSNLFAANTWYHIAVCRSGTTVKAFVNGTEWISGTAATNLTSNGPVIGRAYTATDAYYLLGYISNFRVVKGTALYTLPFTPSTTPLTAVSGTSLLTCQSNRFIDNSSNNFAITVNGNTSVQRFSPFNPTAAYDAATIGGSGYFDGTGDYLSTAYNINWSTLGTYTLEFWVYHTSLSPVNQAYLSTGGSGYTNFYCYANGRVGLGIQGTNEIVTAAGAVSVNTWTHIAYTFDGTTTKIYINGVQAASGTTAVYSNNTAALQIANGLGGLPVYGYMSGLRLVLGSAATTFTLTAPPTAITNTSLLLNFTNAGVWDAAMMNDLEAVGNARIVTTVKKYNTGSMYFDGTGDYLVSPANAVYAFGTGDFTWEGWVNFSAMPSNNAIAPICQTETNPSSAIDDKFWFGLLNNAGTYQLSLGRHNTANRAYVNWSPSTGTWYHVAVVRYSGTIKMFISGTEQTVTSSTVFNGISFSQNGFAVGLVTTPNYLNGYIDDFRITKGYARYTANFTPPTAALPLY